ncbi:TolC family protein [Bacteroidota bacterium]
MRSLRIVFCGLLFFTFFSGISQNTWSLEECILYALDNNIRIKQQGLNIEISKNNLTQAKASILPNLNLSTSQNFRYGRSVDPLTYEFTNNNSKGSSFSVNSGMYLFNGLQTINNIAKNKLYLKKSIEDLERAKNDLSLNIAMAYLQVLFNTELYTIAKNQLDITSQQVEQTKILVDAGSITLGNLLEIQAQYSTEELQLVNAENQIDLSYLNLKQMLDLGAVEDFRISIPEFIDIDTEDISFSVNIIFKEALSKLPQIKSAEFSLLAIKKNLSIAKGQLLPSLSVGTGWYTGYSDNIKAFGTANTMSFSDQIDFAQNRVIGFNLTIPVFNRLSTKTNISNARLSVLNSEYNLQLEKNQLFKEIQQAYSDAKAALKQYIASQKTVESLEENFKYTQNKYNVGMVNTVDYNLAKNNLTKARSDLLQAKYNYIFNQKILDFYRGNPITI